MGYEHIEIERQGHVATLWLNRPEKLNAMSEDMWADIPSAMADLGDDHNVRVVILAGRGPAFTVGIDVGMLAALQPSGPSQAASNLALYHTIKRLQVTASCMADSPMPVIAAIHGHCLGAGMDLITACDIRLASADANFSIRETRMGLVADIGTLQRLPSIVGQGHTAELAYTGMDMAASRALEIGLVNRVYDDADTMLDGANQLAAMIAESSPLVVRGIKKVLSANNGRTVDQALDFVAHWNASFLMSNDLMEAIAAFGEKRKPEFEGH
jgi:enoyl-CoA hydratase/carnithine racemase